MTTLKTRTENLEAFFLNIENTRIDIDFNNILDFGELAENEDLTADDIYRVLEDAQAFAVEIIYYTTALEYLRENDPSLRKSLELAHDRGYTPDNLSSETLASLLASQNLRDDWNNAEAEITEFLENDLDNA